MKPVKKRIGLIVNPIAGIGGRVGLKGSDGREALRKARELGGKPESPKRAKEALLRMASIKHELDILTYPHEMGEDEARECGFEPIVIGSIKKGETTSEDTKSAARDMAEARVDALLFAGGDGTARDIYDAIGGRLPVIGIPAGVKIHSAVFAINAQSAGDLVMMFLREPAELWEAEVMDVDEEAFRRGLLSTKLYGYLKIPYQDRLFQGPKRGSIAGERSSMNGIAEYFAEEIEDDYLYIVGPGTTTRAIHERLGLPKTLLGVDVIRDRQIVASDVNENQILRLVCDKKAKILVTPIGGQGFIFGRGNQQISPDVIKKVGKEHVIVVATGHKMASLGGRPLLVDTGDDETDDMLSGYIRVITGYRQELVYRVGLGKCF
ncbi:MAG TPA: ATP-NAD kinase family protein [Clostridia bacterium]|nr:ATP-NAD kinase family protein [Clostridia bacterium]